MWSAECGIELRIPHSAFVSSAFEFRFAFFDEGPHALFLVLARKAEREGTFTL
jgi:hypothetical protein